MQFTQALHRAALIRGSQTALLDASVRRTWAETADRIARLAAGFKALGLEAEDRVAVLSLNSPRFQELYYAVAWAGGAIMPLNIRLSPKEILEQVADGEPRLLVVDDTFLPMLPALAGQMPSVRWIVHAGDGAAPAGLQSYEALIAEHLPAADAEVAGDRLFGIFYTGGTTAAAKGVMLSHANLTFTAYNIAVCGQYRPSDVYLHAAPMFHLADVTSVSAITLCAGTHAFIPAFQAEKTLAAIESFRVTLAVLVPTMINAVLASPRLGAHDLSSLRMVIYGASPISPDLLARARSSLPCAFAQAYGMTETTAPVTFLPPEDHVDGSAARLRSAGVPMPNVTIRILDAEDRPLPPGEVGEICIRSPQVMMGYWRKPEATAQAIRNGFLHSGDLGTMDENGYVYLVDRAKDMIITGGENVYSVEVERALCSHEAVLEAAVFGIPHAHYGEQVHAVVTLHDGRQTAPEDLIAHCRDLLAGYKCPRSIEVRAEPLPKSAAGKILKRDLRQPFWERHERQII